MINQILSKTAISLAIIASAVAATGCNQTWPSNVPKGQAAGLQESEFKSLVQGKTKEEVVKVVGRPKSKDLLGNWIYCGIKEEGLGDPKTATIYFGANAGSLFIPGDLFLGPKPRANTFFKDEPCPVVNR